MVDFVIVLLLIALLGYILFAPELSITLVSITLTVIVGAIVGIKVLMLLLTFFAILVAVLYLLTE